MDQLVLGIDIGSSKICSLIAKLESGAPHIIGVGVAEARGVRKGAIVNIEEASRSIKESINDAQRMAGVTMTKAIISISGAYTKSLNSTGIVRITNHEIGIQEINHAMQAALYNAKIPDNHEALHVLPFAFKVDDKDYIDDPFGMIGSRLEVSAHIVASQKSGVGNLKKAVKNAGIEVETMVLSAYASSIAVLSDDEKALGVACVDIGASSCDIMIHRGNAMQYNYFLGVGSGNVTQDIAYGLSVTSPVAEKIKIDYGTLYDLTPEETTYTLDIPTIGSDERREISLERLHFIIFERVKEMARIIKEATDSSALGDKLGSGLVVTGGMATMKGLRELMSGFYGGLPIRIAYPKEINGSFGDLKNPAFATAIGLVLYGTGKFTAYEIGLNKKIKHHQRPQAAPQAEKEERLDLRENDLSDLVIAPNKPKNDNVELRQGAKSKANGESALDRLVAFLKKLF